jgi:hypothetical protein
MSDKNTTASNFFASADHHLGGRWAPPGAAAAGGAGAGAGVAWATNTNVLVGGAIGAVAGVVAEEGARALWCDNEVYATRRIELLEKEAIRVAAKYF